VREKQPLHMDDWSLRHTFNHNQGNCIGQCFHTLPCNMATTIKGNTSMLPLELAGRIKHEL